jgi:hypothetical protein
MLVIKKVQNGFKLILFLLYYQSQTAFPEEGQGRLLRQEADQADGGQCEVCGGSGHQEADAGQEDH